MRVIVGVPAVLAFVLLPFYIAAKVALFAIRCVWRMALLVAMVVKYPEIAKEAGTRLAGAAVWVGAFYFAVWFWGL